MDFHAKRKQQKDRLLKKRVRTSMSKMLGSFTVTVVVGVSAVTYAQTTPKATFESVEVSQEGVYFAGEIIDDNSLIVAGSLSIRLQSPLDKRSQTIETGYFSGFFEQLRLNTTYELQVRADYGFGIGTLASTSFKTPATLLPYAFASFSLLEAFGSSMDYACWIEAENALERTTYQIKASAGTHVVSQPLSNGENEGTLHQLLPYTTYQVVIEAITGGQTSVLATRSLTTQGNYAGKIDTPQLIEKEVIGEEYDVLRMYTYSFSTRYVDALDELSQIRIVYDYRFWYELNQDFPPQPTTIFFPSELAITSPKQTFTLPSFEGGCRVFLELHASINGNDTILDSVEFDTAPLLFASVYPSSVGMDSFTMTQYVSQMDFEYYEMSYTYTLKTLSNQVVATLSISEDDFVLEEEYHHIEASYEHTFHALQPATHYQLIIQANYFDVLTNSTLSELVYEGVYATCAPYTLQVTTVQMEGDIEVTITLFDPNHVFLENLDMQMRAVFYYDVYTGEEYDEYYYSGYVYLSVDDEQVSFVVPTSNGWNPHYVIVVSSNLKTGNPIDGFIELYYMEVARSFLQIAMA